MTPQLLLYDPGGQLMTDLAKSGSGSYLDTEIIEKNKLSVGGTGIAVNHGIL